MDHLKWSPTFETGVPEIDDDHRKLFALVEAIREGIAKRDTTLTRASVKEFIVAAENHFTKEEEILVRIGFPDIDAHKVSHASLVTKATQLKQVCNGEMDPEKASACYDEIVAFLLDDIVRGDSQFKSYLNHYGFAGRKD